MAYFYKKGSQIKVPAEVTGSICEQLEASGGLTAKRLLDASRPVDAPLHGEFLWDDTDAAEKYREHQAAQIIRCIVITPESVTKEPVRAFVNVTDKGDSGRSYQSLNVVLNNTTLREQMLEQALKDLHSFEVKYSTLSELAAVFAAIHEVSEEKSDSGEKEEEK